MNIAQPKLLVKKVLKPQVEPGKILREQIAKDIHSKTTACSNTTFECSMQRLEGQKYCLKHILMDPLAPYKQCAYIYSFNGKRCLEAAPKYDKKDTIGYEIKK